MLERLDMPARLDDEKEPLLILVVEKWHAFMCGRI